MTLATHIFLKGPAVKSSLLSSAISLFAVVATTANGFAAPTDTNKPHLQPNAPRTVVIKDTETPPIIRAGLLQSTLIILPAEEKVATVFGGDTVDWVFDGGHVASRFISIKPKLANSTTDIHIISDHGNEYTTRFRARGISTSIPRSSSLPATRQVKKSWRRCPCSCPPPSWTR